MSAFAQSVAQASHLLPFLSFAVQGVLNSLPEGCLIAFFAWASLRLLPRQNAGTRFAVWFAALISIASLPMFFSPGAPSSARAADTWTALRPVVTVPSSWAVAAACLWIFGAGVSILRLGVGLARLRALRRGCVPIPSQQLDPTLRETALALALKKITVATSDQVQVPSALGFWEPTIVLPVWALAELSPPDLNAILLHEAAHLGRLDDWTNLLQKIVRAVFFFHPAVWWIEKRLSVEREMACDDAVLAETANPQGYAACLVALLEKSLAHRGWSMAQAAVHRAHEAALRLAQILDSNRPPQTRLWKPALGLLSVFSFACLFALPHGPELVAFDRDPSATTASERNTTASLQRNTPPDFATTCVHATMIPAAFKLSKASPSLARPKNRIAAVKAKLDLQRMAPALAGINSAQLRFRPSLPDNAVPLPTVTALSARWDGAPVPSFQAPQMLVVILPAGFARLESSSIGNSGVENLQIWRVQMRTIKVWRVLLFTSTEPQAAPVVNSI